MGERKGGRKVGKVGRGGTKRARGRLERERERERELSKDCQFRTVDCTYRHVQPLEPLFHATSTTKHMYVSHNKIAPGVGWSVYTCMSTRNRQTPGRPTLSVNDIINKPRHTVVQTSLSKTEAALAYRAQNLSSSSFKPVAE